MKNNNWNYSKKVKKMTFTKKHQEQVLRNLGTATRKKSSRMRIIRAVTVAALFAMLALSTIFSPVMENVLAKIPYISKFVDGEEEKMEKRDNILNEVVLIVEKNNMELNNLAIDLENKVVKVYLEELPENQESLTEQIRIQLEKTGFSGFIIDVILDERKAVSEQNQEEIEEIVQANKNLTDDITKRLQKEEYELMFPLSARIDDGTVHMTVIVPNSEKRIDHLREILKEEAKEFGESSNIDIRQVEKIAREQEKRWEKTGAISDIGSAFVESSEFPVTGFAYSFHPYPLEIIVKTSLSKNDAQSSQVAENIRDEIDSFVRNDEDTETIRNDEYDVKVLSKDKKEIE